MGYGVIPDLGELEQWMRQGLTPQQCSERYAARGEHVPAGTISVARWRHGWPGFKADHTALIPWQIQARHRRLYDHMMLEAESRRRQGKKLAPAKEKQLNAWLARLRDEDAVVHYSPTSEEGWHWVQRRPGIDLDIISMPDLDDEREVARLRPKAPQILRQMVESSS